MSDRVLFLSLLVDHQCFYLVDLGEGIVEEYAEVYSLPCLLIKVVYLYKSIRKIMHK